MPDLGLVSMHYIMVNKTIKLDCLSFMFLLHKRKYHKISITSRSIQFLISSPARPVDLLDFKYLDFSSIKFRVNQFRIIEKKVKLMGKVPALLLYVWGRISENSDLFF